MRPESNPEDTPLPRSRGREWTLDDIPYDRIDHAAVREDALPVYLAAAASFVEILSPLYTRNLVEAVRADGEAVDWLAGQWEPEELQHGAALRRYVQAALPDFGWERAHERFTADYAPLCTTAHLEPDEGLEMAARCVVEVGTSTYYTALGRLAREPVLRELCRRIAQDEVRHFAYFHAIHRRYARRRAYPRWRVARVLLHRVLEVGDEDARIAADAVRVGLPAGHPLKPLGYLEVRQLAYRRLRAAYPYGMAARMLLKPLALPRPVAHAAAPVMAGTARLATSLAALDTFRRAG